MTRHLPADRLTFRVTTRSVRYGDGRTFSEYAILMLRTSKVVGVEHGPRRSTAQRGAAIRAARARIKVLQRRRLFTVCVTRKHIADGEARSCNTCAVAQALWHNQERMGFPKRQFRFEVSPYACWVEPRGIVVISNYDGSESRIPADRMPEIVTGTADGRLHFDSMAEWAMNWDGWAESRYMPLREWRAAHGYDDDHRPSRPGPCSFVLDLDAMVSPTEIPAEVAA